MSKPAAKVEPPAKKTAPIVEVVAETGDHVEAPPPEVLEADPGEEPDMTQLTQAAPDFRGDYSARAAPSVGFAVALGAVRCTSEAAACDARFSIRTSSKNIGLRSEADVG